MTREEQFRLYENAVKAVKNEKPCTERKTVSLDYVVVQRMGVNMKKIKDVIFKALSEWQTGLRGRLDNGEHGKVKIKIMMNVNDWEKLSSPNYNGISEYLNDILNSYYSRR